MLAVPCGCGKSVRVELFQAGTSITCPSCNAAIAVPGMTKLKELSGDHYPHLSPVDKVLTRLERREPPFDGTCQRCGNATATHEIPVEFATTVEREIEDDGGVRLALVSVELRMGAAVSHLRIVRFPLLLCTPCCQQFQSARSWSSIGGSFGVLGLLGLTFSVAVVMGLFFSAFLSLATSVWGSCAITVVVASRIMYSRGAKQGNRTLKKWLHDVPWVSEAIAVEDEYSLTAGPAREFTFPHQGERGQA